ncbi:MAG: hypothetical protein PUP92_19130 [Rhizonema sp. PD38]|nr:hypothetical protein [Rhizonema sp. PD38]
MTHRHAHEDIESKDDEKLIALTDDRVAAAGFIYADVNAFFTSSSRQIPEVAKANSVEER